MDKVERIRKKVKKDLIDIPDEILQGTYYGFAKDLLTEIDRLEALNKKAEGVIAKGQHLLMYGKHLGGTHAVIFKEAIADYRRK